MIGIDTNILVRYIVQDDPIQTAHAVAFIESLTSHNPGYISLVAIVELYWVLRRSIRTTRAGFLITMQTLLGSVDLVIQEEALVRGALRQTANSSADFSDCLIAECSRAAGCDRIVTFDKAAAKMAGMTLLI